METAEILKKAKDIKILVCGDLMLDIYEFCETKNSKEIPSEKTGKRAYHAVQMIKTLGGAGNVAMNLEKLGCQVALAGLVGDDGNAVTIDKIIKTTKIEPCVLTDSERPTTTKSRIYVDKQYLLRRDEESTTPMNDDLAQNLIEKIKSFAAKLDAVVISDYAKGFFTPKLTSEIIKIFKEKNKPVIVDMKPENIELYADADLIIPNELEARQVCPNFNTNQLQNSTKELYDKLNCKNLMVTLGEKGIAGFGENGFFHQSTKSVDVVDAVGCGDTVRASIAIGTVLGLSQADNANFANLVASVAVRKLGTSVVTPEEVMAQLE